MTAYAVFTSNGALYAVYTDHAIAKRIADSIRGYVETTAIY